MKLTCMFMLVALWGVASSSILEILREACPYSNFCTTNSLKRYNKTEESMPCCYNCYCDEHCSMFGDCCPDVEAYKVQHNTHNLGCKSAFIVPERTKTQLGNRYTVLERDQSRYRLFDFCPSEYKDDSGVIDGCNGTFSELLQYADLVLVSGETGALFKNRYCAICHGVREFTSWSLKVEACVHDISKAQLTLSETTYFVINYCLITSERPRGTPVTARMLECPEDAACSGTDMGYAEGCIDGPYMPYFKVGRSVSVYKNVFCYKFCTGEKETEMCPDFEKVLYRFTATTYQVLLNLGQEIPLQRPKPTLCNEAQLEDRHFGRCRRLYCPPFKVVSFGRCVPISSDVTNLHLTVNVIYRPTEAIGNITLPSIQGYNETLKRHHLHHIYKKHKYPACNIKEVFVAVHTEKPSRKFVRMLLQIVYEINENCSLDYIGKRIQKRKGVTGEEIWLLANQMIKMAGRFTFYEDPPVNDDANYYSDSLIFLSTGSIRVITIQHFFLCPYFKLSLAEYQDHVEKHGQMKKEYHIKHLSPLARYLDGFYPLSADGVAVCVDTYLQKAGKEALSVHAVCVLLCVSLQSLYIRF